MIAGLVPDRDARVLGQRDHRNADAAKACWDRSRDLAVGEVLTIVWHDVYPRIIDAVNSTITALLGEKADEHLVAARAEVCRTRVRCPLRRAH